MDYEQFKRIMDIFLAILLGVIFLPISLIVALAVKLESPEGPVFADIPKRAGKNGRPFRMFKFRSMYPNAHYLLQTDPKMKAYYQQFVQSLSPDQHGILKDQYTHAVQNEGEDRPYAQWREKTGLPAYFRGYAFDQWPNSQSMYTPEQLKMFDSMMTHLKKNTNA